MTSCFYSICGCTWFMPSKKQKLRLSFSKFLVLPLMPVISTYESAFYQQLQAARTSATSQNIPMFSRLIQGGCMLLVVLSIPISINCIKKRFFNDEKKHIQFQSTLLCCTWKPQGKKFFFSHNHHMKFQCPFPPLQNGYNDQINKSRALL